jgi:hypothetical protein
MPDTTQRFDGAHAAVVLAVAGVVLFAVGSVRDSSVLLAASVPPFVAAGIKTAIHATDGQVFALVSPLVVVLGLGGLVGTGVGLLTGDELVAVLGILAVAYAFGYPLRVAEPRAGAVVTDGATTLAAAWLAWRGVWLVAAVLVAWAVVFLATDVRTAFADPADG